MTIIVGQARKKEKGNKIHELELTIFKASVLFFLMFVFRIFTGFSILCGNIITVSLVPDVFVFIFKVLIILRKGSHHCKRNPCP